MAERVYLIDENDDLRELNAQGFKNEADFQALLAKHPNLLSGDESCQDGPAWLLITQEMSIADNDEGRGRWYVDHLFLDRQGIPTFVEVKRSSDTRIRREVAGQMLDYAANAVANMSVETIRASFESGCEREGNNPNQELAEFLSVAGSPGDELGQAIEGFWEMVKTNIEAEKIRMVFAADIIPPELQRIVEFLNGQMDPAEVIAVELKSFVGEGLRTLVPRILGRTTRSKRRKPRVDQRRDTPWDKEELLQTILECSGSEIAAIARDLIEWSEQVASINWGSGSSFGCAHLNAAADDNGKIQPFTVASPGNFSVNVQGGRARPELRKAFQDLIDRLNRIEVLDLPEAVADFSHRVYPLALLADEDIRCQLKSAYEAFIDDVNKLAHHET